MKSWFHKPSSGWINPSFLPQYIVLKPKGPLTEPINGVSHPQNLLSMRCTDVHCLLPLCLRGKSSWHLGSSSPSSLPVKKGTALSEMLQLSELANQLRKLGYSPSGLSNHSTLKMQRGKMYQDQDPEKHVVYGQVQVTILKDKNFSFLILTTEIAFKLWIERLQVMYTDIQQVKKSTYVPQTELNV